MRIFIIEIVIICILFTVICMSSVNKTMINLELAKLDYPKPIIDRLIGQGRVSKEYLSIGDRIKKKWPAIIAFGVIMGLLVKYINGCNTFVSGFTTSYLIWFIVDWYDCLVIDCLWFCHSKRCVIPGSEDLIDSYHDYMFHVKGSLLGMLIGVLCCVIAGLITIVI